MSATRPCSRCDGTETCVVGDFWACDVCDASAVRAEIIEREIPEEPIPVIRVAPDPKMDPDRFAFDFSNLVRDYFADARVYADLIKESPPHLRHSLKEAAKGYLAEQMRHRLLSIKPIKLRVSAVVHDEIQYELVDE